MDPNTPRFTYPFDPFDPDPSLCPVCQRRPCLRTCRLGVTRKDLRRFSMIFTGLINADDPPGQGRVYRDG